MPRAVDSLGVHGAHAGVGVEQDRRDREQDERQGDVEEAGAEDGEEQEDDAQRRHGLPGVRDADDDERAASAVAQPRSDGQRDGGGDPDRGERDEQVLAQQRQQLAAAHLRAAGPFGLLEDEPDRVAELSEEGEGHAVLSRDHGMIRRWTSSKIASRPTAITTQSPPPTAMLEMNSFWRPSSWRRSAGRP
jgi:hypothetical protein